MIGLVERRFGPVVDFCVDGSGHPLILLVVGFSLLNECWYNKFDVNFDEKDFEDVDPGLVEYARAFVAKEVKEGMKWTLKISDANIFVSAQIPKNSKVDARPTGPVPMSDIVLGGVQGFYDSQDKKRLQKSMVQIAQRDFLLSSSICVEYFSTSHLVRIMTGEEDDVDDDMNAFLSTLDRKTLLSIKRSGDWGQVENARKFDKVFVTRDKHAALYAHFRGVKYIYMSYEDHVDDVIEGFPPFFRYTFVVSP